MENFPRVYFHEDTALQQDQEEELKYLSESKEEERGCSQRNQWTVSCAVSLDHKAAECGC